MHVYGVISALFGIWVVFVLLVGWFAIRIMMLLSRQRRAEIAYRMHLARAMGAAVRADRASSTAPGDGLATRG